MAATPLILEIKGNSLDDGPGIRTVIFFKGCTLSCSWCHNPESKRRDAEISFDSEKCIACDTCLSLCSRNALDRSNPFYIDRDRCDLCFDCIELCPSEALSRVGEEFTIDDIVQKTIRDKPFFDTSGGGVTLSGGEPLLYVEFAGELLQEFRSRNIHSLVETCGLFRLGNVEEHVLPWVDAIYYDIKILDEDDINVTAGFQTG